MENDGLTIVYTGKGKGKTTAALGIALRATGYKKKTCMIQFIKGSWHYGEMDSSKRLEPEFEMVAVGKGFVGIIDDKSPKEDHEKVAKEAIRISNEKIQSGNYDIVILDEINYAINLNLISVNDVLNIIKSKPKNIDLIFLFFEAPIEYGSEILEHPPPAAGRFRSFASRQKGKKLYQKIFFD